MTSPMMPARDTPPQSVIDGLGRVVALSRRPRRIVSLVPSLTEALFAFGLGPEIVGITNYCVEPAARVADVPKVGGTKTPDINAIRLLQPDLVIASAEENVREHVEGLIDGGATVYVSLPASVRRSLAELRDLALLTGTAGLAEHLLRPAEARLIELGRTRAERPDIRYFCPIWRRPYMVAAPDTYMSDLLYWCGGVSVMHDGPARYFPVELDDVMALEPEVVLLPSEPYPFAEKHLGEIERFHDVAAVRYGRVHLVDGQLLTWYGPRIGQALDYFSRLFDIDAHGDPP
ncbi:MAG: ABC transporter substrate-binding protein [Chloroflexi bacterium]|nr:ABC transporter substrate-binding protein [Chloroflexota bacterium]